MSSTPSESQPGVSRGVAGAESSGSPFSGPQRSSDIPTGALTPIGDHMTNLVTAQGRTSIADSVVLKEAAAKLASLQAGEGAETRKAATESL